jgi:hypothetical protein
VRASSLLAVARDECFERIGLRSVVVHRGSLTGECECGSIH